MKKIHFEQGIRRCARTRKSVMVILEVHDGVPVDIYEIKLTDNLTGKKNDNYRFYVPYLN